MKKTSRTLSKKDDINHQDSLDIYKHFRQDDKSGLVTPIETIEYRENTCGFCGQAFGVRPTEVYAREVFHKSCVDKMCRGELNR